MSTYYQTLNILKESALPPAHQSWHDFNRAFLDDGYDMEEFVEFLNWNSGVESFLEDSDNYTVKKCLDSYEYKFIQALQECIMEDTSYIIEKLAPLLYE